MQINNMSKTDLVGCLFGQKASKLSKAEKLLLEIIIVARFYQELSNFFKSRYRNYHSLIKHYLIQEENMFNVKLMPEIINDIIATKQYSLAGIAIHTQIPEEVLSDVAIGINNNPTLEFSRKIFELHMGVRRHLYDEIMRKIVSDNLKE